jgi:hypothetical protein
VSFLVATYWRNLSFNGIFEKPNGFHWVSRLFELRALLQVFSLGVFLGQCLDPSIVSLSL